MSGGTRWVIHLPTALTSRHAAVELVTALRASLTHLPVLDFGGTSLSEEDEQSPRTRVWCDARMLGPGGGSPTRCALPAAHPGSCRPPAQ
nr:hypothetical protein [Micromonospora sp. DSM 115978]